MKIAFTTLACPDWTLDEIVEHAAEYGYDAVDFRGLLGQMGVYIRPEFTDDADKTRRLFRQAGLTISCFSSGARIHNAQAQAAAKSLAEVKEYATLCRRFDVPFLRVFGGKVESARDQAVQVAAQTLEEMARIAAPACILLETHDDWTRAEHVAAVMQAVQADNVGVCWDLHHPFRMAGEAPETTLQVLGPWIRNTHVKDSAPTEDGFAYCLPGQGDVPLGEMIDRLAETGYDGYLTVEWEKAWHKEIAEPDQALPAYASFLATWR